MPAETLQRNFLQRIFGIPATRPPRDEGAWDLLHGEIVLDLNRLPELSRKGGAVRLEGKALPHRVLVVRAEDGSYHAFWNQCKHFGRRLDPVPGTKTIQCCSVNKTTYDLNGNVISGPGKAPVDKHLVRREDGKLVISLE